VKPLINLYGGTMTEKKEFKMNRRDFLKLSGLTAAGAMLTSKSFSGKTSNVFTMLADQTAAQDGWYPGQCKMCMQSDCITRNHVVDGVVVQIEGDLRAPNNAGRLCPRGNSGIATTYNPWRVKSPLKRTNPKKGLNVDPGFVEISWEEAIKTVATHMDAVRKTDPRKFVLVSGFGQFAAYFFGLLPFMAAFGSPNDVPSRGQACAYHFFGNLVHDAIPDSVVDMDLCEYVVNIGRSMGPNVAISSSGTKTYVDAIERGCKIITVDPRCSPEASKAAQWVPIRVGTDLTFVMGMLNVMLYEIGTDKLDVWSIKNRSNGPYLIGPDGDYVRDPASSKPLVFSVAKGMAVPFDDTDPMSFALEGTFTVNGVQAVPALQLIKQSVKNYTPEWAETISTVPATTVRQIANDFVSHAKIGSTIVIDGFTFPFRPVGLQTERGSFQHPIVGPWTDGVAKIILELVGAMEVPGGVSGNQSPSKALLAPDADGVKAPTNEAVAKPWVFPPDAIDSRTFYPVSHTLPSLMAQGILDPKTYHIPYDVEVLFSGGGNPIHANFNRQVFEAAYAKVPFTFTLSLTLDETAVMADIVLPEDSFLEREQFEFSLIQVVQPHKVMTEATRSLSIFGRRDTSQIRKVYNTRNVINICMDLADGMGMLTGKTGFLAALAPYTAFQMDVNKRPTMHDFGDMVLKTFFGPDKSLDAITDKTGPVFFNKTTGKENYNYFYWPDNKTRFQMYMVQLLRDGLQLKDNLKKAGLSTIPGWKPEDMDFFWKAYVPVPAWVETTEFSAHNAEFDLWAFNWKTPGFPFYCGDTYGNAWLNQTMKTFDPYEFNILLNAATAAKKGLVDGDTIAVESHYGKTQGILKTTQLIHPDAIGIAASHGARSNLANPIVADGTSFNVLCPFFEKDKAIDPISGGIEEGPAVKVYKL
jgi:anaerobic selenocysteine-containing dehydrogenase